MNDDLYIVWLGMHLARERSEALRTLSMIVAALSAGALAASAANVFLHFLSGARAAILPAAGLACLLCARRIHAGAVKNRETVQEYAAQLRAKVGL